MKRLISAAALILSSAVMANAVQFGPSYYMIRLEPGKKTTAEFTITNTEGEKLKVIPSTRDWFIYPDNKKHTSDTWLRVKNKEFSLGKGESTKVKFTARAPKDAKGELVGMVSMLTEGELQSSVRLKVSAAVYLAILGTEKVKGTISQVGIQRLSDTSVRAAVMVQNKGNVHLRPKGRFKIFDAKKKLIANFIVEKGTPVYPGQQKAYFGTVNYFSLDSGKYSLQVDLEDVDRPDYTMTLKKNFSVNEEGEAFIK